MQLSRTKNHAMHLQFEIKMQFLTALALALTFVRFIRFIRFLFLYFIMNITYFSKVVKYKNISRMIAIFYIDN